MAQILSTRVDLLNDVWIDRLRTVQDDCLPVSRRRADRLLHQQLGDDVDVARCLGSGTIASVFALTGDQQQSAVIKIVRRGVRTRIAADCAVARVVAGALSRIDRPTAAMAATVLRGVASSVAGQTDLRREADRLNALHEHFSNGPMYFPAVRHESTASTMIMERVAGEPLTESLAAAGRGPERRAAIVETVVESVLLMILRYGIVHLDLHAGNVFVDDDDRVVGVDAGFVVELSDRERALLGKFFLGIATATPARCAEALFDSAVYLAAAFEWDTFASDMAALVDRFCDKPASTFRFVEFARELFAVERRHGVIPGERFQLPFLALLSIEHLARVHVPELDVMAVALTCATSGEPGPGSTRHTIKVAADSAV